MNKIALTSQDTAVLYLGDKVWKVRLVREAQLTDDEAARMVTKPAPAKPVVPETKAAPKKTATKKTKTP